MDRFSPLTSLRASSMVLPVRLGTWLSLLTSERLDVQDDRGVTSTVSPAAGCVDDSAVGHGVVGHGRSRADHILQGLRGILGHHAFFVSGIVTYWVPRLTVSTMRCFSLTVRPAWGVWRMIVPAGSLEYSSTRRAACCSRWRGTRPLSCPQS